jgi:hypothetical protein
MGETDQCADDQTVERPRNVLCRQRCMASSDRSPARRLGSTFNDRNISQQTRRIGEPVRLEQFHDVLPERRMRDLDGQHRCQSPDRRATRSERTIGAGTIHFSRRHQRHLADDQFLPRTGARGSNLRCRSDARIAADQEQRDDRLSKPRGARDCKQFRHRELVGRLHRRFRGAERRLPDIHENQNDLDDQQRRELVRSRNSDRHFVADRRTDRLHSLVVFVWGKQRANVFFDLILIYYGFPTDLLRIQFANKMRAIYNRN